MTRKARVAPCAALTAALLGLLLAGCATFAKSGTQAAPTTAHTFGSLPPLEELTGKTSITPPPTKPPTPRATGGGAGPATTHGAAPAPAAPGTGFGQMSPIDAKPCEHPTDRHAVERNDPGGLFLLIGVAKNCVTLADKVELVLQAANHGTSTVYVSSGSKPLISLLGAGGAAAWSSPCELKPPPPGAPPDTPIAIQPGESVELAHAIYERAKSECGELGVGRYDGQASVAQCLADDAKDGVCNTPKRVPTDRIGVEIKG